MVKKKKKKRQFLFPTVPSIILVLTRNFLLKKQKRIQEWGVFHVVRRTT